VASNHASFFDPIIVGIGAPRKLNYMARDTLFRNKIFARLLHWVAALPLKRDGSDIDAFKMVLNKLSQGKAVLVFPEGTRSRNGNLQRPKAGIGFLEANSSALILPCYVKGSLDALPRHSILPKFSQVSVYYGKPLRFGKDFTGNKRARYMYIAEQVMSAIANLKKNAD
jgi:1-acyl-sn-glycerol-3-phosphate acyltransferase